MSHLFLLSVTFIVQLLHPYVVNGNLKVWMILALASNLCSWSSFIILPQLPFWVSACYRSFGCSLCIQIDDWTKVSQTFNMLDIFIVHIKSVHFFRSHEFCLLAVQTLLWILLSLSSEIGSNYCYFLPIRWGHGHILNYWYFFHQFLLLLPLSPAQF